MNCLVSNLMCQWMCICMCKCTVTLTVSLHHMCRLSNDLRDSVQCVSWFDYIIPLAASWLPLSSAYFCLLEDHWCNQNYMTTSHFVEMLWGMAVGTPGHDVRCAGLVYFLSRYGCATVVKYFMEHMSTTWCDDKGWTLLHYACRWVSFPRVYPS